LRKKSLCGKQSEHRKLQSENRGAAALLSCSPVLNSPALGAATPRRSQWQKIFMFIPITVDTGLQRAKPGVKITNNFYGGRAFKVIRATKGQSERPT